MNCHRLSFKIYTNIYFVSRNSTFAHLSSLARSCRGTSRGLTAAKKSHGSFDRYQTDSDTYNNIHNNGISGFTIPPKVSNSGFWENALNTRLIDNHVRIINQERTLIKEEFLSANISKCKHSALRSKLWTSGYTNHDCSPCSKDTIFHHVQKRLFSSSSIYKNTKKSDISSTEKIKETKEKIKETMEEWKENMMTVPNMLTVSRIVMTPLLGYLVLHESYAWALGLFVAAGVTDLLDGYIARNFENQASLMGSFLDPLADKFLASVLFVTLTMANLIPLPLAVVVIGRDVLLIGAAFYIRYITLAEPKTLIRYFDVTLPSAQLSPTFFSKVNTAIQLSVVALSLAAPVFNYVDSSVLHTLWYLTAGTTVASGIGYIFAKDTWKIVKSQVTKKH